MSGEERGTPSFRFRKDERIRTRKEIRAVFDRGKRWTVKGMRLHVMANGGAVTRAVFVTVRKYGNAVARNRARRVVSECWRLSKHGVRAGLDLAFVIFPGPDSGEARSPQVSELLRRSGAIS